MASTKRHRLAGAGAFNALFRDGRRSATRHLQLLARVASGEVGRVGYVIGKQYLPRAVDRNYARRLMREVVRLRRPAVDRYDLVLRLRANCQRAALPSLADEAQELLDALVARDQP